MSAWRSLSSECPRRTGVGEAERRARTCAWTSAKDAVASASFSAVMPDQRVR